MPIVLPVAVNSRFVGSAVLLEKYSSHLLFATALHLFGSGTSIQIGLPPHGGNCRAVQAYPQLQVRTLVAQVASADPLADLAILCARTDGTEVPSVVIPATFGTLVPGDEVVVLGYPFAPIGSVLETWTPAFVTALARRMIAPAVGIDELVISMQAHVGSSGSAVVGRKDGLLYGIVRGALAPPEVLRIGDVPLGTDTSVMLAPSAHLLHDMLRLTKKGIDSGRF